MAHGDLVAFIPAAARFGLQLGGASSRPARRRCVRSLVVICCLALLYSWPCCPATWCAPGAPCFNTGSVRTSARIVFSGCSRVVQKRSCRSNMQSQLLGSLLGSYSQSCRSRPLLMAFLTCFVKGGLSNIVSQKIFEKRRRLNWSYLVSFAVVSGVIFGCVLHEFYNTIFDCLFGTGEDILTVAKKVLADACFVSPLVVFPMFFVLRDMLLGKGMTSGAKYYAREWFNIMRPYWSMWTFFHVANFRYTPSELRIFAVACMSFVYLIVLSWQSRGGA